MLPSPAPMAKRLPRPFAHHRQMVSVRCRSCEPRRLCYNNTDSVICQYPLQDFFADFRSIFDSFGIMLDFTCIGDWKHTIKGAFRSQTSSDFLTPSASYLISLALMFGSKLPRGLSGHRLRLFLLTPSEAYSISLALMFGSKLPRGLSGRPLDPFGFPIVDLYCGL